MARLKLRALLVTTWGSAKRPSKTIKRLTRQVMIPQSPVLVTKPDTEPRPVHEHNPVFHHGDLEIPWAKADGLLHKRDYFLYGPGHQLAVTERDQPRY
jgi:hypothetical protein